jgi:Uma2 family endonuclease
VDTSPAESGRKLTYADLLSFPHDGLRHELIDGTHYVSPSPAPLHQRVSKRLFRALDDYFTSTRAGEVFYAPIDVVLSPHDVLVPDIVVAGADTVVSNRAIESPPLLVIEIVSPFSGRRDRHLKFRRYGQLGVPHYWIVDPLRQTIECFGLDGGGYNRAAVAGAEGPGTLALPAFPGLTLEVPALWRVHER